MAIQITGNFRGTITVVDAITQGVTKRISISGSTGVITKEISGKETVAAAATFSIPFTGIANAKIISLKIRDSTSKAALTALVTITDGVGNRTEELSDLNMVTQTNITSNKKVSGVSVLGPAGVTIEVDYFIGGDA